MPRLPVTYKTLGGETITISGVERKARQFYDAAKFASKSDLRRAGWTPKQIAALGEPDLVLSKGSLRGTYLYHLYRRDRLKEKTL